MKNDYDHGKVSGLHIAVKEARKRADGLRDSGTLTDQACASELDAFAAWLTGYALGVTEMAEELTA